MKTKSTIFRIPLLMVFLLLPMTLMGCGRRADDTELSSFYVADDEGKEENTENIPLMEHETITQVIEGSDGRKISIDAQVYADSINQVSCYRYVPKPLTEEHRKGLLERMHPAETWDVIEAAVYNTEKETWEFVTPMGESWIYRIAHSEILEEDILNHEDTAAYIPSDIKQVFPIVVQGDVMDENTLLFMEVTDASPSEIETLGLYDIGSIDENSNYSCSFIHVCEADDGQFYVKAVFKKMIDGMPVTVWHNLSTATGNGSPFPVKVWGSLFSEEEIGLDKPVLSVSEAVAAMQEQMDSFPIQEDQLSITKISLEYLSIISSDGELLIVPIWRFWVGEDEVRRSQMSEEIIAVNAISGEFIWESRKAFTE